MEFNLGIWKYEDENEEEEDENEEDEEEEDEEEDEEGKRGYYKRKWFANMR